jgi:sec-independent protein translocase protein TatA
MNALQPFAIWAPSGWELVVIMVVALLLFGKRLPEVARNLGKGVVEFKKGLKGVEEDVNQSSSEPPKSQPYTAETPPQQTASSDQPAPVEPETKP